ncbi:MAG: flagellin [Planctomycetota bacterium]
MATPIVGIPTTRVSEAFVRERLLNQVQYDQSALYKTQMQLSTGHRFQAPSEDPVSALRVMSLQRLLEQKAQCVSNLITNVSFLNASDTTLMSASSLLADARGVTLGAMGTTATDTMRSTAAQQVLEAISQLSDTGNQLFRGRYIFAGSTTTVRPFEFTTTGLVEYLGNERRLATYGDIDLLFDSNLTGDEVFGAISKPVEGSMDLNPVLTFDTKLSDLRGEEGISRGTILISDGKNSSLVDFSGAETIGDIALLIKKNPPPTRALTVELTSTTIKISLDSAGGGALSIQEVAGGTTAAELGIFKPIGTGLTVEGRDLDPVLRTTTPLADVLGVRAQAIARSTGNDNDIILEATHNGGALSDGTPLNGVTLSFVDDPLVLPGQETVVYSGGNTVQVHISAGNTQAYQVVDAINRASAAGDLPFTARLDPLDNARFGYGKVSVTVTATTAGGQGTNFDTDHGFRIENRDSAFDISFATCVTVEDLLNTINGSGAGLLAEINDAGTAINLRSRVSGCDFAIGENGGQTATQLGLRTFTNETQLDGLNFGRGVEDWPGTGNRSNATYDSGVPNSALGFTAKNPGTYWDGFNVSFTNTLGAPTLLYDSVAKTMEFQINPGATTANDIVRLLENHPQASADWAVSLPSIAGATNNGTGLVAVGAPPATTGGDDSGVDFTITRADGVVLGVDIAGKKTVKEILELINNHPDNTGGLLVAQLAVSGNGIELVDNSTGPGPLVVAREVMSRAAIDLGLVPEGAQQSNPAATGGPARATIDSAAPKSGLIFSGATPGTDVNGVRVIFQNGPPGVVYNAVARTLTFGITPGVTTAADIKATLEASPAAATFSVAFDPANNSGNDGTGFVAATDPLNLPTTTGGNATTYSSATVTSPGFDNDIVLSSRTFGAGNDGLQIEFVANAGFPAAVTLYQPGVRLVFQFDPGVTDADDIVAALAAHAGANADLTASLDPADASPNDGSGFVDLTDGTEPLMSGGRQSITGDDVNPNETEGIFTALLRIQQGLNENNNFTITRAMEMLDRATEQMNFSRGELGAREQAIDVLQGRLDTEEVELKQVLSIEYDADMVQVISDFSARQATYQASLQATAKIFQLSLLDYL